MKSQEEIRQDINKIMPGIRSNPNKYPIINKWNNKIFQKCKFSLFNYIEETIEQEMKSNGLVGND